MAQLSPNVEKYFKELQCGFNNLITAEELFKSKEAGKEMFLLDIRKEEDYSQGHLEGAFHAEWKEVGEFIEDDVFGKNERIIVICYSGQTAGQVVGILKSLGYDACALKGGMVTGSENDNLHIEASCAT